MAKKELTFYSTRFTFAGKLLSIPLCNCYTDIINQSKFYSANIPGEATLSGATAKSVFNRKIKQTIP